MFHLASGVEWVGFEVARPAVYSLVA
jgi:hypothetical protein